ncbi:MAG TPA: prolipoprotein diacylglyceryl transferase [Gaiellaceae bacterium]|nr:prolipoprotein diacylglyceryl transferase [Gaiellaceae bacterium]
MPLLASIPSPNTGVVDVGPLHIHMYGLMLLLAIAVCIVIAGRRWVRLGGDWDLVLRVAVWGVAFGIVGARAYHDITSWNEVPDTWWGPFAVWQGGLGVWGGILLGTIAGAIVVRRSGQSVRLFADATAPGLLVAQGIGRWGNWFNQELFGKPTNLPWGLEIDVEHRPIKYSASDTFHPTFLYEFIYDVALAGVLIWVGGRFRIKAPGLFALYVAVYTFGRTFEELLRVDPSHHLLGQRLNFWVSILVCVASTAFFIWWQFFHREGSRPMVRRKPRPIPKGPAMAVPKSRVRPRR